MKRSLAAAALMAALTLNACGRSEVAEKAADTTAPAQPTVDAPAPGPTETAATPAGSGAPAFAPLYPGANLSQPASTAMGPGGAPGAIVTFTTPDSPDAVIAFYKARAEAAGLAQVRALNQGDARAYGAANADRGLALDVVADQVAEGETSVQLSWTSAR
jgi:hypothetical protein